MINLPKEYFIPPSTEVIFVADFFASDITGGAELTSEALIKTCQKKWFKVHSHSLNSSMIIKNKDKLWILFNWSGLNFNIIANLVTNNCNVIVIEYDFKYCQYRSSHLHRLQTKENCNCHTTDYGKFVANFYRYAKHVFFMSEKQKEQYDFLFPEIKIKGTILSSIWNDSDFKVFRNIRANRKTNNKWAILKGGSWIKNQQVTEEFAKSNNLEYELIGGLPYEEFLMKLGSFKGLIFHPAGFDTCPRLVVEAKLMGLELSLNDNVQHKDESWFNSSITEIEEYLLDGPDRFWRVLQSDDSLK
ncbi:hypothetical protein EBU71_14565 [bacterium]|nr:hypothetical protein [Candidatus Elulimicrobium humile]